MISVIFNNRALERDTLVIKNKEVGSKKFPIAHEGSINPDTPYSDPRLQLFTLNARIKLHDFYFVFRFSFLLFQLCVS